jgi:hypothetical protein
VKNDDKPASKAEGVLRDAPDLEFPNLSGMRHHQSRKIFAEAVRWNDEMLSLFPPKQKSAKLEAEHRCHVEFVL